MPPLFPASLSVQTQQKNLNKAFDTMVSLRTKVGSYHPDAHTPHPLLLLPSHPG